MKLESFSMKRKKMFDLTVGSPYADTPEMIGSVNHYTKDVKRLRAKSALLSKKP